MELVSKDCLIDSLGSNNSSVPAPVLCSTFIAPPMVSRAYNFANSVSSFVVTLTTILLVISYTPDDTTNGILAMYGSTESISGTLLIDTTNPTLTAYTGTYENNIKSSHILEYEIYRLYKRVQKKKINLSDLKRQQFYLYFHKYI